MPLIHSKSKAALKKNIKAEMDAHPDKKKQDLAIAFSIQRQARKKMAHGGEVHRLTAEEREHIKPSNFAEPGERKYPIEDMSHARNALARVSQFGSEHEKEEVREKVHAKYPSIGERDAHGGEIPNKSIAEAIRHQRQMLAQGGEVEDDQADEDLLNDIDDDPSDEEVPAVADQDEPADTVSRVRARLKSQRG